MGSWINGDWGLSHSQGQKDWVSWLHGLSALSRSWVAASSKPKENADNRVPIYIYVYIYI